MTISSAITSAKASTLWEPFTIAVAGGSGAGKTTIARAIVEQLGKSSTVYIPFDAYYRDLSYLPLKERELVDFDHLDALDVDLFIEHIQQLKNGQPVDIPNYDFATHSRTNAKNHVQSAPVIVAEGILLFAEPRLRELFNLRIFVDADPDIRLMRRLQRDMCERGRSLDSVMSQWLQSVRPSYLEFVEPSKRYAHVIIPEMGLTNATLGLIVSYAQRFIENTREVYAGYFL